MTIVFHSLPGRAHGYAAWLFLVIGGLSLLALLAIGLGAYYTARMPPGPVSAAALETLSVPAHATWPAPVRAQDLRRR